MKEFKIWLRYTNNSFQQVLSNRAIVTIFITGKSLRIALFLLFLNFLFKGTTNLAGYSREQIIFFYLSFNLIDTTGQLLFREVYRFGNMVVTGGLDQVLVKPIHPLIRVLLGGADVLDLIMLVILLFLTTWFGTSYISANIYSWISFAALLLNGLIIAAAMHVFILGLTIIFITVNHLIMIYRDLTAMLRIPVDLYVEPLRSLLTFILPLGIMLTFPAKALMGLLSPINIIISFIFSALALFLSLFFWHFSLRYYSSASS